MEVILDFTNGKITKLGLEDNKAKKVEKFLQSRYKWFTVSNEEMVVWVNKDNLDRVIFTDKKEN